MERYFSKN